jgi:general stress protein 26
METTATNDKKQWNENDEHLAGERAIAKARELLPSFRTAMFVTRSVDGNQLHMRPMGLQGDLSVFGGTLWFFADNRSQKIREIQRDPNVSLVFQSDQDSLYVQLRGTAAIVSDPAKMRELFTPMVKTWFPDGLDDPNITLIRVDAIGGSFWESPGGMLQVMAAFTKSVITGAPGKGGRSGTMDL